MQRVMDALRDAAERLRAVDSDAPHIEARLLLEAATDRSRIWIYQNPSEPVGEVAFARLRSFVDRRLDGEPLPYILGSREFYGRLFDVDSRVLIPRPETETLLEEALRYARRCHRDRALGGPPGSLGVEASAGRSNWTSRQKPRLRELDAIEAADAGSDARLSRSGAGRTPPPGTSAAQEPLRIVDVGTGSGILGVSLALEIPEARVTAIDCSADALAVAAANCQRHRVVGRVDLVQGDLLSGVAGKFDLIVANLPYIPSSAIARLQREVQREPRAALDGGADGLDHYRRLFTQAARRFSGDGALFAEIGDGQGPTALALARAVFPDHRVQVRPDLAGRDRVIAVTSRSE